MREPPPLLSRNLSRTPVTDDSPVLLQSGDSKDASCLTAFGRQEKPVVNGHPIGSHTFSCHNGICLCAHCVRGPGRQEFGLR